MSVKIRPGDVAADRDVVIRLLSRYVNPAYDGRRFDWLYRDNPAGTGRLWMAIDGASGDVIGTAGALPRRILIDGEGVTGWVLADFCMAATHRTLGPALDLQRACLEDLAGDAVPFCYDFPSRSMEAVYRRLGLAPCQFLVRLVRPLRGSPRVLRGGVTPLRRLAGLWLDATLGWTVRVPRADAALSVGVHERRCGDEFSSLAARAATDLGVCLDRSAPYLTWRYLENPVARHELLVARRAGTLVAYAILQREGDEVAIVDLFARPDRRALTFLLRHAIARAWQAGAAVVSLSLREGHPWVAHCRRLGFFERGRTPVVMCAPAASALGARLVDDQRWFLTQGDRDA